MAAARKKTKTPLEITREHYDAWLEAELNVCSHQSYTIGSRSLTHANLAEIRKTIQFWKGEVTKLENIEKHKGRNRLLRAVPRDL